MIIIKNLFTNRECIRLRHFIVNAIHSNFVMHHSINMKKNMNVPINDINLNLYNKKYGSVHYIYEYKKIFDLLQKINNEIKKINNNLYINDIFAKRWGGINTTYYAENFKHELTIFTNNDKAVSSINHYLGEYIVLFFNETCQVFYDNISSHKFDQTVICPKGSVLFLEKEHFIIKKHSLMYTLGLRYLNKISNIVDILANRKSLYKDIE